MILQITENELCQEHRNHKKTVSGSPRKFNEGYFYLRSFQIYSRTSEGYLRIFQFSRTFQGHDAFSRTFQGPCEPCTLHLMLDIIILCKICFTAMKCKIIDNAMCNYCKAYRSEILKIISCVYAVFLHTFRNPSSGFLKTFPCSWVVILECSGRSKSLHLTRHKNGMRSLE